MNLRSIKMRMWGGYYYEKIKNLKRYMKAHRDPIMSAYLEYAKDVYWHGERNCVRNSYFENDKETVSFGDIVIPRLSGAAVGTFWYEFPDLILPYLSEAESKKFDFSQIDPFMVEGPYELNEHVCINPGDVVLDCGANIGLFSAIASHRGARVLAFEPDVDVARDLLKKTAEFNGNGNIDIFQFALSDTSGKAYFTPNSIDIGGGKLGDGGGNECVSIDTIAVDDFVEQNNIEKIDFIKADIEGAERKLLKGAKNTLFRFAPKLSICTYHNPNDKEVLESIVKESNPAYKIEHRYQKMYCWVE